MHRTRTELPQLERLFIRESPGNTTVLNSNRALTGFLPVGGATSLKLPYFRSVLGALHPTAWVRVNISGPVII